MNIPTLSIVVPTFNRRELIDLMLRALLRTKASPDAFEIILVDDGSTDGTGHFVRESLPKVVYVWRSKNIGKPNNPGLARNCGIRAAKGEWIAFIDCDVIHFHDVIGATLAALNEKAIYSCEGTWIHERDFDCARRIGYESGQGKMPIYFWWVASRDVLIEIGGFDERFTDYGAEDEDIRLRLFRRGLKTRLIGGQFAVGMYASRGVPGGVINRAQNAAQHQLKETDMTVVRNIGVNWGDAGAQEESANAV